MEMLDSGSVESLRTGFGIPVRSGRQPLDWQKRPFSMKRRSPFSFHLKSFTLIELLVVIAIIAVLVAILLPALKMARDSAKNTVCATHLQQLGRGIYAYANDNQDRFPRAAWGPRCKIPVTTAGTWFTDIFPYVSNGKTMYMQTEVLDKPGSGKELFKCSHDRIDNWSMGSLRTQYGPVSYFINQWLDGATGLSSENPGHPCPPGTLTSNINASSSLVFLFCCPSSVAYFRENIWVGATWDMVFTWGYIPNPVYYKEGNVRRNYLFCDGHVDSLLWSSVFNTKSWYNE